MRPRRQVVETVTGFEVTCSGFTSSDRVLALAVRDELDRVDPLPCPHDGDTIEIGWALSSRVEARCADCGVGLPDACDDAPGAVSWPGEGVDVGDVLAVFVEEFAVRRHGPATLLRLDEWRGVDLRRCATGVVTRASDLRLWDSPVSLTGLSCDPCRTIL